ncbi:MAG: hypothetical protein EBU90_06000 [Proteobacteria bacterium]|nr:hypothetical protein [Pseudomonadota bacterium]NBP13988.1 hypothetical protein [bacterium]
MIGLSALGIFRRDVKVLGDNPEISYENIFRVYTTENNDQSNFLYFNLLNSVYLPGQLTVDSYYTITINRIMPWTAISYNEYRTIDLWWLIALANGIDNPIQYPAPGTTLKIIKPELVQDIINEINFKLTL